MADSGSSYRCLNSETPATALGNLVALQTGVAEAKVNWYYKVRLKRNVTGPPA